MLYARKKRFRFISRLKRRSTLDGPSLQNQRRARTRSYAIPLQLGRRADFVRFVQTGVHIITKASPSHRPDNDVRMFFVVLEKRGQSHLIEDSSGSLSFAERLNDGHNENSNVYQARAASSRFSNMRRTSLHHYLGDGWGLLFTPEDFTPVCTTELGRQASPQM